MAAALALSALPYGGIAVGGMFTTAKTVNDFSIRPDDDTAIIYQVAPSLDQVGLRIADGDNKVILTSVDGASAPAPEGWTGTLTLTGDRQSGQFYAGSFGVLQESGSTGEAVEVTLDAMESAEAGATPLNGYPTSLDFLLTGPTTGTDATRLASYGVYASISGLSEEHWTRLLEEQPGAISNLAMSEDAQSAAASTGSEMPVPATPLLVLAGLFGMRVLKRRS